MARTDLLTSLHILAVLVVNASLIQFPTLQVERPRGIWRVQHVGRMSIRSYENLIG